MARNKDISLVQTLELIQDSDIERIRNNESDNSKETSD